MAVWLRSLDRVTYVQFRSVIKHGFVASVHRSVFRTRFSEWLFSEREGIDWIRGHHERDSVEGAALLAAHGLARSRG